jgi:hypothetical protein
LTAAGGLFDRTCEENPLRDWSFVYVLHRRSAHGSKPDGHVPGVTPQNFVGYLNLEKFVPRIAATFERPSDVLLAGASAGGFGSFTHSAHVQSFFPDVKRIVGMNA